jgi:hypothetical protein
MITYPYLGIIDGVSVSVYSTMPSITQFGVSINV